MASPFGKGRLYSRLLGLDKGEKMSLAKWFRWIPTPKYGKCGGAKRDCSIKKPKNWMDRAFEKHDQELYEAEFAVTNESKKLLIEEADDNLYKALKKGDPKKLDWYGRIYRRGALLAFRS